MIWLATHINWSEVMDDLTLTPQEANFAAILEASLADLEGQTITPELIALMQQRIDARIKIARQLIEWD